jgi:hypothetical protein
MFRVKAPRAHLAGVLEVGQAHHAERVVQAHRHETLPRHRHIRYSVAVSLALGTHTTALAQPKPAMEQTENVISKRQARSAERTRARGKHVKEASTRKRGVFSTHESSRFAWLDPLHGLSLSSMPLPCMESSLSPQAPDHAAVVAARHQHAACGVHGERRDGLVVALDRGRRPPTPAVSLSRSLALSLSCSLLLSLALLLSLSLSFSLSIYLSLYPSLSLSLSSLSLPIYLSLSVSLCLSLSFSLSLSISLYLSSLSLSLSLSLS